MRHRGDLLKRPDVLTDRGDGGLAVLRHLARLRQLIAAGGSVIDEMGLLADEEGELAELCENPRDEKWKNPDLGTAIRREYARSYERIQDTLEEMSALLDDIQIVS